MTVQAITPIAITIRQGETLEQHLLRLVQADGTTPYPIGAADIVTTIRPKHATASAVDPLARWTRTNGKMATVATADAGFAVSSDDTAAIRPGVHELAIGLATTPGAAHDIYVGTINVIAAGADLSGAVVPPTVAQQIWTAVVTLPVAPAFTVLPTTTGTPAIGGASLSGTDGTYTGTPTPTVGWQWQRESLTVPGAWSDITDAEAANYDAVSADIGPHLRRNVVLTNAAGSVVGISSNSVAYDFAQIALTDYLYANSPLAPGSAADGPVATVADLSARARTLTTSNSVGADGCGGFYGSRHHSLRGMRVWSTNHQLSGKAEDLAGDARTAAAVLHRRDVTGESMFFAGVVNSLSTDLPVFGSYDGTSSAGNAGRGVRHDGTNKKLRLFLVSDNGVSGGLAHIDGSDSGLAYFDDVRPGDRCALWWDVPAAPDTTWSATLMQLPRPHLGETAPRVRTIGGSFVGLPSTGIAKKGFSLGNNAAGGVGSFGSHRYLAVGAAQMGAASASDKATFLAAFQNLCTVTRRTPAVVAPIALANLVGVHRNDSGQAIEAVALATAEIAAWNRLQVARGEAIPVVRSVIWRDSRGTETSASDPLTTGMRHLLANRSYPYTRINDGWFDAHDGTNATLHSSLSGSAPRTFGGIFGNNSRSPSHANRDDNFVGLPAGVGNNRDIYHMLRLINPHASGPFYWDNVSELYFGVKTICDARRLYGDGKKQAFVIATEGVFASGQPTQAIARSEDVGLYQLADDLEAEFGCICEVVEFDDYTVSP